MKTLKTVLALVIGATIMTSCNDNKKEVAQEKVDLYTKYVDSVSNINAQDDNLDWELLDSNYDKNKSEAENAILTVKDNSEMQTTIDESTNQYQAFKANIEVVETTNLKLKLRQTLLGEKITSDDTKLTWINKDNILGVYQNFVDTVEKNKESYSRKNWDEIKLIYEAIDTRKNTVENEGLSGSDNRKIAVLKLKFAPMYTIYRTGAKSDENTEAKE